MRGFVKRHSLEEVIKVLKKRIKLIGTVKFPFDKSLGYVIAEDVISDRNVPSFNRSAMDGFAVMAKDTFGASENNPIALEVAGEITAGTIKKIGIKGNKCARIMTGAPLPANADAVIMAEYTEEQPDNIVKIFSSVSPGKNVSLIGEDIKEGETILRNGHMIRPQDIGILAALQKLEVTVYKKPEAAIIITGAEIISPTEIKPDEKTIDTNSYILTTLLEKINCPVKFKGIIEDNEEQIKKTIEDCDEDIILITGGTSVGKKDVVPKVVSELGELIVHGINIRPGSPCGLGFLNDRPIFLLPGNPVAAVVCFDALIYQAIQLMQNVSPSFPYPKTRGELSKKITSQIGRIDFVRVMFKNGLVNPVRVSGSGILSTLVGANGYVIVDKNHEGYEKGEKVDVYLFG